MEMKQHEAREQLQIVQQAQRATQRNSIENGVLLIVWGILIAIGLALFDVFSGPVATGIWVALAALGTVGTARYAARFRVVPRRPRTPWFLLVILALYYPVVLIGGITLFPHHPRFLFTAIGLLTALPLILAGLWQWRRTQEV